jgi:RNA polymerase sigma-70 factor (ECF subfamily)
MEPGQASDEQLLTRIRGGEPDALAALIERYRRPLFHYLARMLGDATEAEDVFQETFLRVVRNIARYDERRAARPWIYAIATNLVKNVYRSRAVRSRVEHDPPDGEGDERGSLVERLPSAIIAPDDAASREEIAERVRGAVERLPERGRAALVLFYFQGLRYDEIAAALEVPIGTVKSRIHNALAILARALSGRASEAVRERDGEGR